MEGTRTSLCLVLLLTQLSNTTGDQGGGSMAGVELKLTTSTAANSSAADANVTRVDCLIDTEMGLIAVGSAGGLIVCLLVTTAVLACQICIIQRRVHAPRASRSNADLVSGTGYWGAERAEGLVGPCDASDVMLEEVRADGEAEDERREEAREEVREEAREEAGAMAYEEKFGQMQSSSSSYSCHEIPRDLEDMPLVV